MQELLPVEKEIYNKIFTTNSNIIPCSSSCVGGTLCSGIVVLFTPESVLYLARNINYTVITNEKRQTTITEHYN